MHNNAEKPFIITIYRKPDRYTYKQESASLCHGTAHQVSATLKICSSSRELHVSFMREMHAHIRMLQVIGHNLSKTPKENLRSSALLWYYAAYSIV